MEQYEEWSLRDKISGVVLLPGSEEFCRERLKSIQEGKPKDQDFELVKRTVTVGDWSPYGTE